MMLKLLDPPTGDLPNTKAFGSTFRAGVAALCKDKVSLLAALFILIVLLAALFAPYIAPADPNQGALRMRLLPPGSTGANGTFYLLGTDAQGRDVVSRILFGMRATLVIGLISVIIGGGVGSLIGMIAAYFSRLDTIIMRLVDVLFAFPAVLLGLTIAVALGPSVTSLIIALSISTVPATVRMARASALVVMRQEYMEAGRSIGLGDWTLFFRYLARNCLATVLIYLTVKFGQVVLLGASLSFLGLGPRPPLAELGKMAADGRNFMQTHPFVSTIPATAIFMIVLAFNIVGDAVNDILNRRK